MQYNNQDELRSALLAQPGVTADAVDDVMYQFQGAGDPIDLDMFSFDALLVAIKTPPPTVEISNSIIYISDEEASEDVMAEDENISENDEDDLSTAAPPATEPPGPKADPDPFVTEVTAVAAALRAARPDRQVVETLIRINGNVVLHQDNQKYQKISKTARDMKVVMAVPEAVDFLQVVGFCDGFGADLGKLILADSVAELYQRLWLGYVLLQEMAPAKRPSFGPPKTERLPASSMADIVERRLRGDSPAATPKADVVRSGRGTFAPTREAAAYERLKTRWRQTPGSAEKPRSKMMTMGMLRDQLATGRPLEESQEGLAQGFAAAYLRQQAAERPGGVGSGGSLSVMNAQGRDLAYIGRRALDATNAYRKTQGLHPLLWSEGLRSAGQEHSDAMAARQRPLGHIGAPDRFKRYPFKSRRSAENVAVVPGVGDVGASVVRAWIRSEGHRQNLIGRFTVCGIAATYAADGSCFLTQLFGAH